MGKYAIVGYRFEPFELDTRGHRLLRQGKPVTLGHKGVQLLEKLIERQGDVLKRKELLGLWPQYRGKNTLDQAVRKLRKALSDIQVEDETGKHYRYIQTAYGSGYSFSNAIDVIPVYEQPNNLPYQVKEFKGREKEVREVKEALAVSRLLTLAGAPGIGKTRLALEVASQVVGEYADGVWWVDLTPLSDGALVPKTVAEILGLREGTARPLIDALCNSLRSKQLLLLLDNCEHLVEACASLVSILLQAVPGLRVLVTTREPLNVPGEVTWNVPPLSYPEQEQRQDARDLIRYEAVQLFVAEAQLRKPKFRLPEKNVFTVAEICRQLDGLPLAIELAATWLDTMSVEEILSDIPTRFKLLIGGERGRPRHHQTMRAAIDWSYEFLGDERLKTLLRRLSLFAGGWTRDAAEYVCEGEGIEQQDIFILLTQLARKSLVIAEEKDGKTRYRMLRTIQEYGLEKLAGAGERPWLVKKHSGWFLQEIAERAVQETAESERGQWLIRLDLEYDNIRTVLQNNLSPGGDVEVALRLCGALNRFWLTRGYIREARNWTRSAIEIGAGAPEDVRAEALRTAGYFFGQFPASSSDSKAGRVFYENSLTLLRKLENKKGLARALSEYSFLLDRQGDYEAGMSAAQEARSIFTELEDQLGFSAATHNLAVCLLDLGEFNRAAPLFEESLYTARRMGDKLLPALCLHNLGELTLHIHDLERAERLLDECRNLFQELKHLPLIERTNILLGELNRARGEHATALTRHKRALSTLQEINDTSGILTALEALACTEAVLGHARRSLQLAGWTTGLRELINLPLGPMHKSWIDNHLDQAKDLLGAEDANRAHAEGRELNLEEIIEFALE